MVDSNGQGDAGPDLVFRYYAVALIDVLNQTQHLEGLSEIPETEEERARFITAVRESIGVIDRIRKCFSLYFSTYEEQQQAGAAFRALTPQQRSIVEKLGRSEPPEFQHFSDTVVVYSPVTDRNGNASAQCIYDFLGACAGVMMVALADGIALRGAIDVGIATRPWSAQVYGPVVARVHHLESRIAGYPRIVVGDGLASFLRTMVEGPDRGPVPAWNRTIASLCCDCVSTDQDGVLFVDFLGPRIYDIMGGSNGVRTDVEKCLAFARSEHRRFIELRDQKLAMRYAWLLQYIEARCERWLGQDKDTRPLSDTRRRDSGQ